MSVIEKNSNLLNLSWISLAYLKKQKISACLTVRRDFFVGRHRRSLKVKVGRACVRLGVCN